MVILSEIDPDAATTSTAPPKKKSRSCENDRFDVYLSFRGLDTRFSFTDHLYDHLKRAGILTFRDDDELERGEDLGQQLETAIKQSSVSIIVFSENYASSKWCLDELERIIEQKKIRGGRYKVIPIYYKVDASDVRYHMGSYKEAFNRYSEKGYVSLEKIKTWKAALTEAGNLVGFTLNKGGYESRLISIIVEDVVALVKPKLFVANHPVGLDSRVNPIVNLFSPSYRQFSLGTINKVTNNLDKKKSLREGIYWIEYLVQMNLDSKTEKTWAIVKQFNENCSDKFEKEIRMVTKIQAHPNLISLLGYCIESNENIIIYSYTEHGSLLDYVKVGSHICLSWKERLNICFGAASALQHLHKVTSEFRDGLIHGDVNPATILLDKNWVAKVSNYAGSHVAQIRPSFSTNTVKDPFTRYAPEYEKSNLLTKRVDVYAFGIVLFQVLCRRSIWVEGEESMLGYIEQSYAHWAKENVDFAIKNGISEESLKAFTDCIGRCLESIPYKRPTMQRVVADIMTALKFQEDEGEAIDVSASFRTKSEGGVAVSSVSLPLSSSSCRQFPLTEIKDATNNFAVENQLGKGGEGTVYLAEIYLNSKTEKLKVAVKLLKKDLIGKFEKEIVTMTKIKHPNIVSLLGYCKESDDKVLIYEYMGKGSLADYAKVNCEVCLSWKQRLNICLGAANGLQYLHGETEEFPYGIIHRDVKPANILINDKWDAKVSDFGMLKLSNVHQTRSTFITSEARGTPGYFAPECCLLPKKQLTRKIDVYSFGLVMFQVLCLKKRWEVGESSDLEQNEDVALLAYDNIDNKIKHQISEDSKYAFIDIIAASLLSDPKGRPSMNDVVHSLEVALKYQEQSEEEDLYEIDIPLKFTASVGTRIHGLACWFDVLFNGSTVQRWLTTAPGAPTTHWYQLRCVLSQPIYVMPGQEITGQLHMIAHNAQSYTIHLTMSAKMWGPGAEQGGILQTSSCKLDLKEPYCRMSLPQAYSAAQDQQSNQLLQSQDLNIDSLDEDGEFMQQPSNNSGVETH